MNREELLKLLKERGSEASGELDEEFNGWLSWTIEDDLLTVQFERFIGADVPNELNSRQWRLQPTSPGVK